MILGEIIRQYRQQTGCSMEAFAKKSGLSKAYISILERNMNPVNNKPVIPSLETIKAVSAAVGMDFNEVLKLLDSNQTVSLENDRFQTTGLSEAFASVSSEAQEVAVAYDHASPKLQEIVRTTLSIATSDASVSDSSTIQIAALGCAPQKKKIPLSSSESDKFFKILDKSDNN